MILKPTIYLGTMALLSLSATSYVSAQSEEANAILAIYTNPETQPKSSLPRISGPTVMERRPIFTLTDAARDVRYAVFLYEDGTIIWTPAWNDYGAESSTEFENLTTANPDGSFSSKAGPYLRGVVDSALINDFKKDVANSNMCDHPGFAFLHGFGQPHTYLSYANGACVFSYTHSFNYERPEKIRLEQGLIDRDGKSEEELLANEHPMIQRAYNTHHFFTDAIERMIDNVESNGTVTEVGVLDLEIFDVETE